MGKFGSFMKNISGGLVTGGMNVLGGIVGGLFNRKQNQRSMQFSREMYDKQYKDSLDFWRMQNEYNDPKNQMARLKAAGLNPALLYGGSGSGASGMAGPISSPTPQTPQFRPFDASSISSAGSAAMDGIYSMKMKAAQLSNLEKQGNVIANEAILKSIQAYDTLYSAKGRKFDLGQKERLKDVSAEFASESLRQLRANIRGITLDNEIKAAGESHAKAMRPGELRLQAQQQALNEIEKQYKGKLSDAQLRLIEKQIKALGNRMELDRYEIELNKIGLSKGDPRYWRVLEAWKEDLKKGAMEAIKKNTTIGRPGLFQWLKKPQKAPYAPKG